MPSEAPNQAIADRRQTVPMSELAEQITTMTAKTFSTGSVGYGANGKIIIDGKRHQVSLSVVEIGSRPKTEK